MVAADVMTQEEHDAGRRNYNQAFGIDVNDPEVARRTRSRLRREDGRLIELPGGAERRSPLAPTAFSHDDGVYDAHEHEDVSDDDPRG
ncbi:hypothetical protein [Mesorhizobium helmanticense]|uniref:hypothetical protein n=1 Tax=Mesorhizobium helmanticense TaxID=1776423 RepID=UPI0011B20C78|nr:hypothetical protein [Mesorhizobium helmanticense]